MCVPGRNQSRYQHLRNWCHRLGASPLVPMEASLDPSSQRLQMLGKTTVSIPITLMSFSTIQRLAAATASSNDSCSPGVKNPGLSISAGTKSLYFSKWCLRAGWTASGWPKSGSLFWLIDLLGFNVLFNRSRRQIADTRTGRDEFAQFRATNFNTRAGNRVFQETLKTRFIHVRL